MSIVNKRELPRQALDEVLKLMACLKCRRPVSLLKSPQGSESVYCNFCNTYYPIQNSIICCFEKDEKSLKASRDWDQAANIDYIKAATALPEKFADSPFVKLPTLPPEDIVSDKVFLDLGCGYGRTLIPCTERGTKISVGIDFSMVMLNRAVELCRQYEANCILINGNIFDIPFQDDTFDVVYSAAVTLHLNRHLVGKVIQEVKRVLKPGGKVFFVGSFPNKFYLWRPLYLAVHWASLIKQYAHHRHLETDETSVKYCATYSEIVHLFQGFSGVNVFPTSYELLPKNVGPFAVPFRSKIKNLNQRFSNTVELNQDKRWHRLLNPLATQFEVEATL